MKAKPIFLFDMQGTLYPSSDEWADKESAYNKSGAPELLNTMPKLSDEALSQIEQLSHKGILGVVTGGSQPWTDAVLSHLEVYGFFSSNFLFCDARKSEEDTWIRILAKLESLQVEEVYMLGDTYRQDVQIPKKLGIRAYLKDSNLETALGLLIKNATLSWHFQKTSDILATQRKDYIDIILKIFENGMGIKGWSEEQIEEQTQASTLLGLLKSDTSSEGYFFATIPGEQMNGKHLIWIDAVSITKNYQNGSWLRKGIDDAKKIFPNHDFGIIGGRSQNPIIFKFFSKIGSGEYIPFEREYTPEEMDYLTKNIYEVSKPNAENKLNKPLGICKNTYSAGKLGDYPLLECPATQEYEHLLSQNGFDRFGGDSVILIKIL